LDFGPSGSSISQQAAPKTLQYTRPNMTRIGRLVAEIWLFEFFQDAVSVGL